MPRYYFHFCWQDDLAADAEGRVLDGFDAAYKYACGLIRYVRRRFPDAGEDWWIEIGDGSSRPTAVLPAVVVGKSPPKLGADGFKRSAPG